MDYKDIKIEDGNYEIYLSSNGRIEVGMYYLDKIMNKMGFDNNDTIHLTARNGFVGMRKVSSYCLTDERLADLLYDFAERVLDSKDSYELDQLVKDTFDELDEEQK